MEPDHQLNSRGEFEDIETKRSEARKRLYDAWEEIFEKYGNPENEDDGDIIDLNTGEIVEDRGHLKSLSTKRGIWQGEYPHQGQEEPEETSSSKKTAQHENTEKTFTKPETPSNIKKVSTSSTNSNCLLDDDAFDNLLTPNNNILKKRAASPRFSMSPRMKSQLDDESDDDTMLLTPAKPRSRISTPLSRPPTTLSQPIVDIGTANEEGVHVDLTQDDNDEGENGDSQIQPYDDEYQHQHDDEDDIVMAEVHVKSNDGTTKEQQLSSSPHHPQSPSPALELPPVNCPMESTGLQLYNGSNPFAYADEKHREKTNALLRQF